MSFLLEFLPIIIYVLLNLFYRNYLKYFITEIYTEFLNMNRSKK